MKIIETKKLQQKLSDIASQAIIQKTLATLTVTGEAYLVGGVVRDLALGKESTDIDLTTSLTAQEIEKSLLSAGIKAITTGKRHGTITAVIHAEHVEITSFRKPTCVPEECKESPLKTDLSGRDFTINAIAFDPKTLGVIDPFHGLSDLENSLVRAIGNPKDRFEEDPLRLMRMVRFGPAEQRTIEKNTLETARNLSHLIKNISTERIRIELEHILLSPAPGNGIRSLLELGILKEILPEILPTVGFEQNHYHIHDVFEHTLWVLDRSEPDLLLRLASLFHDIGKPDSLSVDKKGIRHFYQHEIIGAKIAYKTLKRLKFGNTLTKEVCTLIRHHMRPLECGPAGVRRTMHALGVLFDSWLALKRADAPPKLPAREFESQVEYFLDMLSVEKKRQEKPGYGQLAVNGHDLIKLGIPKGPEVGRVLRKLQEIVLENPDRNDQATLLNKARTLTGEQ